MKYLDADKLIAEINALKERYGSCVAKNETEKCYKGGRLIGYEDALYKIASLQQEQQEVDMEKLGGIARHLIAVKYHEEDIRLDEDELLLLERIGYPERLNARKEE